MGVEGLISNLFDSLYTNAETMIKWGGLLSDKFDIQQGVRQVGVLSAALYKVYDNKLLDRFESVMLGIWIGGTDCNGPTCADDRADVTKETLRSILDYYSCLEQYLLLLLESVVLTVPK